MDEISGTLCVNQRGEILLLRSFDGSWELPCGRTRFDETLRQGAVRETLEKIGLVPRLTAEIVSGQQGQSTVWIFVASLPNERIELSDEHCFHIWVSPTKAQSLLTPSLARIVGDYGT